MKIIVIAVCFLIIGGFMGAYGASVIYVRNHAFDWMKGYQVGLAYEQDRQHRLINLGGLCTYSAVACPDKKGK